MLANRNKGTHVTVYGFTVEGLSFEKDEYAAVIKEMKTYLVNNSGTSRIYKCLIGKAVKHVDFNTDFDILPSVHINVPVTLYCTEDKDYYEETWVFHVNAATGEHINGKGGFTHF